MVVLIFLSLKLLLCCNEEARINAMAFLQELSFWMWTILCLTTRFCTNGGKHCNGILQLRLQAGDAAHKTQQLDDQYFYCSLNYKFKWICLVRDAPQGAPLWEDVMHDVCVQLEVCLVTCSHRHWAVPGPWVWATLWLTWEAGWQWSAPQCSTMRKSGAKRPLIGHLCLSRLLLMATLPPKIGVRVVRRKQTGKESSPL